MGDELGMVSGQQALINALNLVIILHHVGVNELSHLNVVSEHVERKVVSLSNSNEFIILVIWTNLLESAIVMCVSASLECSDWANPLLESVVRNEIFDSESSVLSIEELTKGKRMSM